MPSHNGHFAFVVAGVMVAVGVVAFSPPNATPIAQRQ